MDPALRALIEELRALGVAEYEGAASDGSPVRIVLGTAPPRAAAPAPEVDLPPETRAVVAEEREKRAREVDVGFGVRVTKPGVYGS